MEQNKTPEYSRVFCITSALALINILVFLRTDFSALTGMDSPLIQHGCLSWYAFFYEKEYYRVFTYMFLHGGISHIFSNMLSLLMLGWFLESRIGALRFTILYFSSGILAGFASMLYNMMWNTAVISVGASGAIFGILGGLFAYTLLHSKEPGQLNFRQLVFSVFLSLYCGIVDQSVDNAAHIGGFLSGVLLCLLLCRRRRQSADQPSEDLY